jgi:hypothetical protein
MRPTRSPLPGRTTNGYSFADGPIKPAANNGAALDVSGTAWSDLFLASGAVVNFAAGDVTITHASNDLGFAGGLIHVGSSFGTNAFEVVNNGTEVAGFNRTGSDGRILEFYQDGSLEGSIGVSGTTVSLSGAHLARASQWDGDPRRLRCGVRY